MYRWQVTFPIVLLPAWVMLLPGEGCLNSSAEPESRTALTCSDTCSVLSTAPVVEASVADPVASITRNGEGLTASADNRMHPSYDLDIPQGQMLVIGLTGQASWSPAAAGRAGFFLLVQQWQGALEPDDPNTSTGTWLTIGSAGASGQRTGEATASGRARVVLIPSHPGTLRLRVVVRTVATPCTSDPLTPSTTAVDLDSIEIRVHVYQAASPDCPLQTPPSNPSGEGWLDPAPVSPAEMQID
jgi:hypothetical protein